MSAKPRDFSKNIQSYGVPTRPEKNAMKALYEYPERQEEDSFKKRPTAEYPDIRFGQRTAKSENLKELMNPTERPTLLEHITEKSEAIYHSAKTMPLGKSLVRGHEMPESYHDPNFRFGVKSHHNYTAKELISPQDTYAPDPKSTEIYKRTHGRYDPGEQSTRQYQWEKTPVNPENHRFGLAIANEKDGAAKCLKPTFTDKISGFNEEPAIVSQIHQNFNDTTKYPVGKTRSTGDVTVPETFVFGRKTAADEWGASECIKGDYSKDEQLPDKDLGTSLKFGYRNQVPEERIFGCPTIRYDIKPPKRKSVADSQNYGNEPDVAVSLYPSKFASRGIYQQDFDQIMTKDFLRDLMVSTEICDNQEFEVIYEKAHEQFEKEIELIKRRDRTNEDGVTIDMFRQVLKQFTEAQIM